MRVHRTIRHWLALVSLLQFTLPAVETYADALLERESATAFAHAESRSDKSCRATHSTECALCQVVHRSATPERSPSLPPCAQAGHAPMAALIAQAHSAHQHRRPNPRAPPLA